jgi:hypothetical protein
MSSILKKLREGSSSLITGKFDYSRSREYDFSLLQSDEEIKEITLQLVMIRKAYDFILNENSQKRTQIEIMKKQITKLQNTTVIWHDDQTSISSRVSALRNQLESLKYRLEEEHQNNKTYEHMLNRMKLEHIGNEVKSSSLHDSLNVFQGHLGEYLHKSRKNKEENAQSQKILKTLKEELKMESKNKEDLIKRLESTARSKKEATLRRQQRIKRQGEIAEIAANENKNAEEIALKQDIHLHKLYFMFLKFKQEKLRNESEETEEAFINIRVATGIYNIQTIVEGFLKREELTLQLNASMLESEKQLNALKKKSEKVRLELNKFFLISNESALPFINQINTLHEDTEKEKKALQQSEEDNRNIEKLFRQISEMARKIKLSLKLPELSDIVQDYKEIAEVIVKQCKEISDFKEKYFQQLQAQENKKILSLYRSLHPSKVAKPKFLRDTSLTEDQKLIPLEDD